MRRLAFLMALVGLSACVTDHNYAAGPNAPTDITAEMAKARCRLMVEGQGSAWFAGSPAMMAGMAIDAENRRKRLVDTCMIAQGYQRADK